MVVSFFFFNDTATTEIYTLSLHDALPISGPAAAASPSRSRPSGGRPESPRDRKSTRLNSSHLVISYAVLCLKKTNNHRDRSLEATERIEHFTLAHPSWPR